MEHKPCSRSGFHYSSPFIQCNENHNHDGMTSMEPAVFIGKQAGSTQTLMTRIITAIEGIWLKLLVSK